MPIIRSQHREEIKRELSCVASLRLYSQQKKHKKLEKNVEKRKYKSNKQGDILNLMNFLADI